jgi:ABC-2 type transport system ATP-binding protein
MLAELERVADYLVLIRHGRVRLNGTVEDLLAAHRLLSAPTAEHLPPGPWEVIESSGTGSQTHQLVRLAVPELALPPGCESRPVGVEELALAYLREAAAPPALTLAGAAR